MLRKSYFIVLILIILGGIFLRVYPFQSKSWIGDYDTQVVGQALDIGKGISGRDFSLAFQNVKYPYLIPYLLFISYGIFYFIGLLTGLFSSSEQFVNYIFSHLDQFYRQSRLLIAFWGIAIFILTYLIVRQIFLKNKNSSLGALLACFFSAFSLLGIQFSQQVRPHIPVAFFILLSYYFYLLFLEKKTKLLFFLLAGSASLAIGTFMSGIFALVFLPLANYFIFQSKKQFKILSFLKSFFSFKFVAGVLLFLSLTLLFYPHIFLGLQAQMKKAQTGISVSLLGVRFSIHSLGFGFTTIFKVLFLHETALGVLLIIFLFIFLFRKKKKIKNNYYYQAIVGWWVFVLSFGLSFGLIDNGWRYRAILPLLAFLYIGLAILFVNILSLILNKKIIISLIVFFLCLHTVQAFRLVRLISRSYTIEQANEWIEKNIDLDKVIIFQKLFTKIIPNKESIKKQIDLAGDAGRKEEFLLSLSDEEYPLGSRSIARFDYLMDAYNGDILKGYKAIQEMKPDYFIISSRSLEERKQGYYPEYQIANFHGRLIKKFSPFKNEKNKKSLNFPSGFGNPLIDLWQAKQLGPGIEIYKLKWD